ncbi:MAG TPA: hypothetical protein VFQ60_03695 [Patescibacteria group bacterium]|nr:hypothetical protein [Patescibacteria group bacterium]
MTKFLGFDQPLRIPSLPQEKKSIQPWVNELYEAAAEKVIQEVTAAMKDGKNAGTYLGNLIEYGTPHPIFKNRFDAVFSAEARKKIRYVVQESASASEVAGRKIKRGIFIVDDDELYQKLHHVFSPGSSPSHGVYITGSGFSYLPGWRETGVLIMKNQSDAIDHEIRHSIDPHENTFAKREGYHQLLAELFAEYHHLVVQEKDWMELAKFVANEGYYEEFTHGKYKSERPINLEAWWKLVGSMVRHARDLSKKYTHVEVQRMILTAKTNEEFLAKK